MSTRNHPTTANRHQLPHTRQVYRKVSIRLNESNDIGVSIFYGIHRRLYIKQTNIIIYIIELSI